jgi:putative tryptophan/tyrosine transport system substrate-binding protein
VLWNPGYGPGLLRFKGTEAAGPKLGVTIVSIQFPEGGDGERAFTEMRSARVEAVTVLSDPVTVDRRAEIVRLAARYRLPVIYALREAVEEGGLISYATSLIEQWHRAAGYVAKILKGAKPAELPIAQPTAFELWINKKAAKTIGITIPPSLLLRADQVIE